MASTPASVLLIDLADQRSKLRKVREQAVRLAESNLETTTQEICPVISEWEPVLRAAERLPVRDLDAWITWCHVRKHLETLKGAVERAKCRLDDAHRALRLQPEDGLARNTIPLAAAAFIAVRQSGSVPVPRRSGFCPDEPVYVVDQGGFKLRVPTPRELLAHDRARRESTRRAYGKKSGSRLTGRYAAIVFRLGVRTPTRDLMRPRTRINHFKQTNSSEQVIKCE